MCLQKSSASFAAHHRGCSQVPIVKLSSLRLSARLLIIIIFLFLQFFTSLSTSNRHHFSSHLPSQQLTLTPSSSPTTRNYQQAAASPLIGNYQQSKSSSNKAVSPTNGWYSQHSKFVLPFFHFAILQKT